MVKIQIDPKSITTLKSGDNYKQWKQEIQMLVVSMGAGYLFANPPMEIVSGTGTSSSSSSSAQNTSTLNISAIAKGKGKGGDEEEITKERWDHENEQVIFGLYFTVAKQYQQLVFNLAPKTLKNLFRELDKLLVSADT